MSDAAPSAWKEPLGHDDDRTYDDPAAHAAAIERWETTMKRVSPYLNFPGRTEEAFAFYRSVFGGEAPHILRYRDMGTTGADGDMVAHVALPIADDTVLMGSDVIGAQAEDHVVGTNVEIHLAADDADEARRVFDALAKGGTISMPLERVAWSELFGACIDRYGVRWMVDYTGEVQFGAS